MSEASRKMVSHFKKNSEPDNLGYYKHVILDLLSKRKGSQLEIFGLEPESSARACSGAEVSTSSCFGTLFGGQMVEGLSGFKQERLKMLLNQTVESLNQEIDEIHGRILATFQIDEDLKKRELNCPSEDLEEPEYSGKEEFISEKVIELANTSQYQPTRKAYDDFQVLCNAGFGAEGALDQCFADIHAELSQKEQNLEEYLNILASKCRQMCPAEKELLGQRIHKLPAKSFDRIVEIVHSRKSSEKLHPDKMHIDLEEEVPPHQAYLPSFCHSSDLFTSLHNCRIIPHYGDYTSTLKLFPVPTVVERRHESTSSASGVSMCLCEIRMPIATSCGMIIHQTGQAKFNFACRKSSKNPGKFCLQKESEGCWSCVQVIDFYQDFECYCICK